jgi:2-polyprenyl-6-methoxyphenol hydroxylase-like FAD-dependent oxidoreductase
VAQNALIVGAGSGISASFARALAREGHRIALAARRTEKLDPLRRELQATTHACDASDPASVAALFAVLDGENRAPDVVLYNASGRVRGPLVDLEPERVRDAILVSAYGAFLVAQEAARRMLPKGSGAIFFTGASASMKGFAGSAPFAMGKFALRGLAESVARELQPKGIHVAHFVIDGAVAAEGRTAAADRPDSLSTRTPSPRPISRVEAAALRLVERSRRAALAGDVLTRGARNEDARPTLLPSRRDRPLGAGMATYERRGRRTDVLVIGAGPVGLALATGLVLHGLAVRIVDRGAGPKTEPRAAVIWPRGAEVLDDLGAGERVRAAANELKYLDLHSRGRTLGQVALGPLDSHFPFPLLIEQDETERLLAERLLELGTAVEWNSEAVELQPTPDRAETTLRRPDGAFERVATAWVVGCDGARSFVRRGLGIAFEGRPVPDLQILQVDAVPHWRHRADPARGAYFIAPDACLGCFPLPDGRHRFFCYSTDPNPDLVDPPTLARCEPDRPRGERAGTAPHRPSLAQPRPLPGTLRHAAAAGPRAARGRRRPCLVVPRRPRHERRPARRPQPRLEARGRAAGEADSALLDTYERRSGRRCGPFSGS